MRKFILLQFTALALTTTAQPVIDADDMPMVGETYGLAQAPGMEIADPGNSVGEDIFWDYSDLQETAVQYVTYGSVSDVPIQYQFIFNNPFSESFSNLSIPIGELFEGVPLPISEAFNFLRADEEGYFDCGYAAGFNDIPIFAPRNPTDRIFMFPLQYGMSADTNASFFEINIPTFLSVKSNQVRMNQLDAWGAVETPYGVFDAIRVRSVVNGIDTVFSETLGIDQVFVRPETIEYRWLAPNEGVPVLQINTVDGTVTQVSYKTAAPETGIPDVQATDLVAYPNPAVGHFKLDIPDNIRVRDVVLISLSGQNVNADFEQTGTTVEVDVSQLTPGVYRATIIGEMKSWGSWVVIQQ